MPRHIADLSMIFLCILLGGFLFANPMVVLLAIIPIALIIIGYVFLPPQDITVEKHIPFRRVRVSQWITVHLHVKVAAGIGPITICDVIPEGFEIVEGSNFHTFFKGPSPLELDLSYKMKCSVSGRYVFQTTNISVAHAVVNYFINHNVPHDITLDVIPKALEIEKIKNMNLISKIPMPHGAKTNIGVDTNDFKEVRLYQPGDSFKSINWKVTARNVVHGRAHPIVNEFVKEGRKSVVILLDNSAVMNLGTAMFHVAEYAIEAVNGLCEFYIKNNCLVSLLTFGGEAFDIPPGTGRSQLEVIVKNLIQIKSSVGVYKLKSKQNSISDVIQLKRQLFHDRKPLFLVVTRICSTNAQKIEQGIKDLYKFHPGLSVEFPVVLVNINGMQLWIKDEIEQISANILKTAHYELIKDMVKRSIYIDWHPTKESFSTALARQVIKQ